MYTKLNAREEIPRSIATQIRHLKQQSVYVLTYNYKYR